MGSPNLLLLTRKDGLDPSYLGVGKEVDAFIVKTTPAEGEYQSVILEVTEKQDWVEILRDSLTFLASGGTLKAKVPVQVIKYLKEFGGSRIELNSQSLEPRGENFCYVEMTNDTDTKIEVVWFNGETQVVDLNNGNILDTCIHNYRIEGYEPTTADLTFVAKVIISCLSSGTEFSSKYLQVILNSVTCGAEINSKLSDQANGRELTENLIRSRWAIHKAKKDGEIVESGKRGKLIMNTVL